MPRQARVVAVGVPHHITQRGNNRQEVFLSDEDRQFGKRVAVGTPVAQRPPHRSVRER